VFQILATIFQAAFEQLKFVESLSLDEESLAAYLREIGEIIHVFCDHQSSLQFFQNCEIIWMFSYLVSTLS
jgi:exopolyphosphatase/pppGpp-phosphohydrolase